MLKKIRKSKNTIENVNNLYDSRQKIIDLLNDNLRIRSEAIYKANKKTQEQDLKYLLLNKCFKDCQ